MTEHIRTIERLVEESVRKWVAADHAQDRLHKGRIEDNVGPYLAVSRATGAGGSEIARRVGQILGWDVLDREIVEYMVSKYGTPRDLVEFVDEKTSSWLEDLFSSWIEGQGFTQATYVHRLCHLLLLAAHHGNVVVVGRGAHLILPRNRGLSIRVVAPRDARIERIASERGLSQKEARKYVEESDRERAAFIKENFAGSAADQHIFDLTINSAKWTTSAAAELIVTAIRSWIGNSGISISPPPLPPH